MAPALQPLIWTVSAMLPIGGAMAAWWVVADFRVVRTNQVSCIVEKSLLAETRTLSDKLPSSESACLELEKHRASGSCLATNNASANRCGASFPEVRAMSTVVIAAPYSTGGIRCDGTSKALETPRVQISTAEDRPACTGFLRDKNTIVTAAHCLKDDDEKLTVPTLMAFSFDKSDGTDTESKGHSGKCYPVASNSDLIACKKDPRSQTCVRDIAVCKLSAAANIKAAWPVSGGYFQWSSNQPIKINSKGACTKFDPVNPILPWPNVANVLGLSPDQTLHPRLKLEPGDSGSAIVAFVGNQPTAIGVVSSRGATTGGDIWAAPTWSVPKCLWDATPTPECIRSLPASTQ